MNSYNVSDALLRQTKALPASAAAITTDAIDLGHGTNGQNVAEHEFVLDAPALTVGELPNAQTMIYAIVTSANADMSSPTVVNAAFVTQTGADGAGAAAVEKRFRLPSDCQRYVGIRATKSGAGSAATASVTLSLKF